MSDFTPGPWQYIHPGPLSEGMRIFSSNQYIGFVGNTDMSVDEMNANAHLIAAAPDLFEHLLYAIECVSCGLVPNSQWLERSNAALKKARGEA